MTLNNSLTRLVSPFVWLGKNIQDGRQRSANIEIARMLQNTEYRNESVDTVYRALCDHDLQRIRGYPTR